MPTRPKRQRKKPYPDFPLTPHPTGQWCKKIRGKLHYFGKEADAALKKYLAVRDDLQAGREPREYNPDGCSLRDLCNRFLTEKHQRMENNELSPRTFGEYRSACERVQKVFGKERIVEDIQVTDFGRLRGQIATTRGAVALTSEIVRIRSIFKFAYENGLIDKPVRFGTAFSPPSKKVRRAARQERQLKNGLRMFENAEAFQLVDQAGQHLRAMILLGLNCGFGNTDCGRLPVSAVDLDAGWIDFPRPKTAIARRIPLWQETIDALKTSLAARPQPKEVEAEAVFFVTKYGRRWIRPSSKLEGVIDNVGRQFGKLLVAESLKRPGVSFYALRHTFETIGGETRDQVAVDTIMGHVGNDMASLYRERISDDRLIALTEFVRQWFLNGKPATGG